MSHYSHFLDSSFPSTNTLPPLGHSDSSSFGGARPSSWAPFNNSSNTLPPILSTPGPTRDIGTRHSTSSVAFTPSIHGTPGSSPSSDSSQDVHPQEQARPEQTPLRRVPPSGSGPSTNVLAVGFIDTLVHDLRLETRQRDYLMMMNRVRPILSLQDMADLSEPLYQLGSKQPSPLTDADLSVRVFQTALQLAFIAEQHRSKNSNDFTDIKSLLADLETRLEGTFVMTKDQIVSCLSCSLSLSNLTQWV
jgi:hypothetical protein